jgi:Ca2+-transporting ATPase
VVGAQGGAITLAVLGAFALAIAGIEMPDRQAVTVSFLTLAFAQLGHVFNMRGPDSGLVRNEVTRNPFVWGALVLCTVLLLAVVYLPGLADVLRLAPPGIEGWAIVLALSALPLVVGPFLRPGIARPRARGR